MGNLKSVLWDRYFLGGKWSHCLTKTSRVVACDFEFAPGHFSLVFGQRGIVVIIIIDLNDLLRASVWAGAKNGE